MIVLLVEDNAITGESLCELMRARGWTAEWAANGEVALTKIKAVQPNVAVLDYGLPDKAGTVVLEELLKAVPHVVIFSAEAADRLREVHKEHPGLRILTKPVEPEVVLAAIEDTAMTKTALTR